MAKVKGTLKYATVETSTPSGEKSQARAVDPQDTVVVVGGKDHPEDVVVKDAPREYILALLDKKAAEERAEKSAEVLRAYVGELRDTNAKAGDYQKTYRVVGEESDDALYQVDVQQSDKWTAIKGMDYKALREKDTDAFNVVAEEDTTISIRDEVLANRKLRAELSKGLLAQFGIEGVKRFFKQDTVFVVREDMDKKQYTLTPKELAVLSSGWKKSADSVRNAMVNKQE